jgi:hypothetical protein
MVAKLATANWSGDNFFRIEGHLGLTKAAAISAISALIVNEGLPIQVLDCDVNYKGPTKWIDWYSQFYVFVKDSLSTLREKQKTYAYDPLKKIQTLTNETSYRQTDEVQTILNDFTAYNGVFYNTKTPPPGSPINEQVIAAYKEVIPQQKVTDMVKGYYEAIEEVKNPAAKKLIVLKDLAGLEYLGGVPRGGTFVLLHSSGTVIGDGCLPFYYRVDQSRIFSV